MSNEITPESFVDAVLAIIADPKAAQRLRDQKAELDGARAEYQKAKSGHDAREKDLARRDDHLQRVEAELKLERDRLAKLEASLEDRARKIAAGENELQAKIVAHGQEYGKGSAELNSREQAVAGREKALEKGLAKLEADRAEVDKKLAAARAFVAA